MSDDLTETTYCLSECDMRLKEPLYASSRGKHAGKLYEREYTMTEGVDPQDRLEHMTCQWCGRRMWGYYVIEEQP